MTTDTDKVAAESRARKPGPAVLVLLVIPVVLAFAATSYLVAKVQVEAQIKTLISTRLNAVRAATAQISGFLDYPITKLESVRREPQVITGLDDPATGLLRLTEALQSLASRNPSFGQVRWIDAAGKEQVRLQRVGDDIVATPSDRLADKSSRYYFTEAMQLDAGEFYYSPLDLNIEAGEIEQPFRPTVRIATPVMNSAGVRAGILIVNRDAQQVIDIVDSLSREGHLWLVNEDGYWLRGPSSDEEWGFMLGHGASLATRAPTAWAEIQQAEFGHTTGADGIWIWGTARPVRSILDQAILGATAAGRSWKIVNEVSGDDIAAIRATVWRHDLPLILLGMLCFGLFQAVLLRAFASQRETQAQLRSSERLRAVEAQAQVAEHLAQHLVAANVNGMLNIDTDGRITLTNPALDALFGYETGELLGQSVEVLLPQRLRAGHELERAQYLEHPTGRRMGEGRELFGLHKDGSRLPVEVSLSPITGIDVLEITATVVDISERRRAQQSLERSAAQQRLLNKELKIKNEDMQELFYSVSHDLRSPLVTVHGYAGVLSKAIANGDTDKANDAIDRIQRSVKRLGDMIDDILKLNRAREDQLKLESIDTEALAAEAVDILAGSIKEAGAQIEIIKPLPALHADYPSMMQALSNLIGNALKYGCPEPGMSVTVSGSRDDDYTWLCVTDSGPGIDPKFHTKIFQLFKQLDPQADGSGLGLTLVRKVAANHGGRAWVESAPGAGARFCFSIANDLDHNEA